MIRLLVIAANAHSVEALKVLLPAARFGLVHLPRVELVREALPPAFVDGCILDSDLTDAGSLRLVQSIRRHLPDAPLFVCAGQTVREWEEDAFVNGVSFVFKKPLRAPLLTTILERAFTKHQPAPEQRPVSAPPAEPAPGPATNTIACLATLKLLRDFSRLFSHSLHFKNFLQEFVWKLREVIGVSRIALFLHRPQNPFLPNRPEEDRRLPCACSAGIAADLYRFFELSLDSGIGAAISTNGSILKADHTRALSIDAQREFEILGGHIAIPVLDRERLLGIAVLGGRLTGLALTDQELQLLFHLMEELGLAIKNSWLHDQLSTNHLLLANILGQMSGGCLVVSRDLTILQANPAFSRLFDLPTPQGRRLEFADLPTRFASTLYAVLTGAQPNAQTHHHQEGRVLFVTVTPFRLEEGTPPSAALVTVEDHTAIEEARKGEIARENARLITTLAEKFSHEIRNALLPLDTHRQLLPTDYARDDFRASLHTALTQETARILRCADQLAFLSKPKNDPSETHSLLDVLRQASAKAATFFTAPANVKFAPNTPDHLLLCEPRSLQHALFEIILNALQTDPDRPSATLRTSVRNTADGARVVQIGVGDPGSGIPATIAGKIFEPFFTTRSAGIGLGLAVARKIIRDHGGDIEVFPRPHNALGDIVITLPAS